MDQKKPINVLSLFDGMSCGHIALDKAGIKVENYFASEIDKNAMKVTMHNYPDTKQIGSVVEVDGTLFNGKDKPKIDLLIGGSPCFVAGTKVLTKQGYKNIEDIKVGDYVLTHKNRYKKVLEIGGDKKPTIEFKAQGIESTTTTQNHPYYTRHMNRVWNNEKRTYERNFSSPEWQTVSDFQKGDFIGLPILQTEENPRDLSEEDCWLIGRYIADGHIRNDKRKQRKNSYYSGVVYSIGSHKLEEFKNNVSRHLSYFPHSQSVHRGVLNSKDFVELLDSLNVGKGSNNKIISNELLLLPIKLLKKVLEGYMSGDGSVKDDVFSATSISKQLITSLNLAIAKVYKTNSSFVFCKRPPKTEIEGRIVNQNNTYTTTFRKDMKKNSKAKVIDDIIWLPFKEKIETNIEEEVFNIEVETDNSYTANNAIVHNCQSFSFAGKRKGMATKCDLEITSLKQYLKLKEDDFEFEGQSYLFWEFIRILHETQPKHFLLENVKMSKKWKAILTSTVAEYMYPSDEWERVE